MKNKFSFENITMQQSRAGRLINRSKVFYSKYGQEIKLHNILPSILRLDKNYRTYLSITLVDVTARFKLRIL